jgi:hypothetical protein
MSPDKQQLVDEIERLWAMIPSDDHHEAAEELVVVLPKPLIRSYHFNPIDHHVGGIGNGLINIYDFGDEDDPESESQSIDFKLIDFFSTKTLVKMADALASFARCEYGIRLREGERSVTRVG